MSNYSVRTAKTHLSQLVREAEDEPATICVHGKPAAVVLSVDFYDGLLEEIEDLRDRLAVHETDGEPSIPIEALWSELDAEG